MNHIGARHVDQFIGNVTDDDDWIYTVTMTTGARVAPTRTCLPWIGRVHLEQNDTSAQDVILEYITPWGTYVTETISVPASSVVTYSTYPVACMKYITYPTAATKVLKIGYDSWYWFYIPELAGIEDDDIQAVYLCTAAGAFTALTATTEYVYDEVSQCIGVAVSTLTAADTLRVIVDRNW